MPEPPNSDTTGPSLQQTLQQALALHRQGQMAAAERLYQRILELSPGHADALQLIGAIRLKEGNNEAAVELISAALRTVPNSPGALSNLGLALENLLRHREALACCDKALSMRPDDADAHHNRAKTLVSLGRQDEALASLDRALASKPDHADALLSRGNILRRCNRHDEAIAAYRQGLSLRPDFVAAHHNLGAALRALGRLDEAIAQGEQALARNPNLAEAHGNLGFAYQDQGQIDQAVRHFERALELKPDYAEIKLALCIAQLPVIYANEAEIARRRDAYELRLTALCEEVIRRTVPRDLVRGIGSSQPFYLAYQGRNDRSLQRLYGSLVCGLMAERYPPAPAHPPPAAGERVRLGIVSGFFRQHSNWKIPIKGWLSQLDRRRFQLFGYHTGIDQDAETKTAIALCDQFVQGLPSVDHWRQAILGDAPHVLIFPEIGMDPVAAQLAAQRLAGVQCASWGHPDTSGFSTIDYFLSSDLMEPPDAQDHYTERLIRLPNLSIYYEPPNVSPAALSRAGLRLRPGATVYWCGQSLFKYLPQFDQVFARIAQEAGDCQFVFIQFQRGTYLNELFRRRLDRAFAAFGLQAADYCIVLPRLDPSTFLAAMGQSDIVLDSIGWSGCNSTLESLQHDLAVVTMPGPLMRGRHGVAILKMMGVEETIADSVDRYVSIAVRLAQDVPWRMVVKRRISERKHRVYRDRSCIAALEEFLVRAAHGKIGTPP